MTEYKTKGITDNSIYFDTESSTVISIDNIRYSLYNLIVTGDKVQMGSKLKKYAESVRSINEFWSIREILDFESTFFYDNNDLNELIYNDTETLFANLESWITIVSNRAESKSGGFCEAVDDINQKITSVVSNIAIAKNLYDSIISKLDDISSASILDSAKKMVESFIDTYVQQIKQKLLQIQNLINRINPSHRQVVKKIMKIKNEMEHMTSEDVVTKIKDEVKGQLGYIMDQFKELDAKAIKHLLDRACAISQNISKPFERKAMQIDSISSYYSSNNSTMSFASSSATQSAMNNGAYRYNPSTLRTKIPQLQNEQAERIESMPNGVPNIPITNEEIGDVTPWNDGKGDSRISFQGQWVTKLGREGWDGVVPEAKIKLMRLQKLWGRPLIVNSGLRPEWYNRMIGGAAKSQHMGGRALDITWAGFKQADKAEFVRLARSVGFLGFGMGYPRFVHIDLGPARTWYTS